MSATYEWKGIEIRKAEKPKGAKNKGIKRIHKENKRTQAEFRTNKYAAHVAACSRGDHRTCER